MSLSLLYPRTLRNICANSILPPCRHYNNPPKNSQQMLAYITFNHHCHYYNLDFVLLHNVTSYTNSLLSRILVNTTHILNIPCTLVATMRDIKEVRVYLGRRTRCQRTARGRHPPRTCKQEMSLPLSHAMSLSQAFAESFPSPTLLTLLPLPKSRH